MKIVEQQERFFGPGSRGEEGPKAAVPAPLLLFYTFTMKAFTMKAFFMVKELRQNTALSELHMN